MVKKATADSFNDEVLARAQPSIVEVFTNSCPNCKVLDSIFHQTAEENHDNFSFFKLNAHEEVEVARRYKLLGVPTMLFFSHGKLVDKKVGVTSQAKIEKRLEVIASYSKEEAEKKEITGMFKLPWK